MNKFNIIVLVHAQGDITISDMKVIDAYAIDTIFDAPQLQALLEAEADARYGFDPAALGHPVCIYLQPIPKR